MIISCPKCNSGFFVAPAQIGSTGRRVKCSKCKNIWLATIDHEIAAHEEVVVQRIDTTMVSGSNLPAIIPIKIPSLLYFVPLIFLFLISFTTYVFYPEITLKFGVCGPMCTEKGIMVQDVVYDFERISSKFSIEYSVANHTNTRKTIPIVQVTLHDAGRKIKRIYKTDKPIVLEPNSSLRNKLDFSNVSPHTKYAKIMIGSSIKFWFR